MAMMRCGTCGRAAEAPNRQGGIGDRALDALQHPKKAAFLAAYSRAGNVTEAAALAGVDRTLHYWWMGHDDDYRAVFAEAHAAYCDRIREEIRTRAVEGIEEPVFNKDGEQVGARRKKSDLLLIFEAKARMPHEYRDNAPLPAQPGPDVARQLQGLNRQQLRELIDRVQAGEGSPPEVIERVRSGEPPPVLPGPDEG